MNALDILNDSITRIGEYADSLRGKITSDQLNWYPFDHDNSIAWLLWHTGREVDLQVAHLWNATQVWESGSYGEKTGLGKAGAHIGYGHTPEEARAIVADDASVLLDYIVDSVDFFKAYLVTLSDEDLDEIIDRNWDPAVSRGARLVSIVDDAAQHIGQVQYVLGMKK